MESIRDEILSIYEVEKTDASYNMLFVCDIITSKKYHYFDGNDKIKICSALISFLDIVEQTYSLTLSKSNHADLVYSILGREFDVDKMKTKHFKRVLKSLYNDDYIFNCNEVKRLKNDVKKLHGIIVIILKQY